jgi:hypothetical protein
MKNTHTLLGTIFNRIYLTNQRKKNNFLEYTPSPAASLDCRRLAALCDGYMFLTVLNRHLADENFFFTLCTDDGIDGPKFGGRVVGRPSFT